MSMKSLLRTFGRASPPQSAEPVDAAAADALILEGNACEDAGDVQRALEIYQRAVALSPHSARAHLNLGNAQSRLGQRVLAIGSYRRAAELRADWPAPHLNLGAMLLREADPLAAEASYREALRLDPDSAPAWLGLGCALDDQAGDAQAALREALARMPGHPGAASRLAQWLKAHGRVREALQELQRALDGNPGDTLLLKTLGDLQLGVGDAVAAHASYRQALQASPHDWHAWDSLLWTMNFMVDMDAGRILAEHRRFGEALERSVARVDAPAWRARERLKIGYVSADFRAHPVACFIEPLLRNHDRTRFEIHCFHAFPGGDALTERIARLAGHWHDVAALDDAGLARRIHDNGIDILVDLGGHTLHNRLAVFAQRPAPVQFTWLGYLCTTGLRSIDYRICDAHTDPPGVAEHWQVETPVRLPHSQWCYAPQVDVPPPAPLPFLANGHWTFGSFNQESKLSDVALRAWAAILRALPGSRLRLVGVTSDRGAERVREVIAAEGLDVARIEVIGRIPIEDYFAAFHDVDVALDTFPYNGATTTCDALLMGVPVAVVAGDRAIARGGVSLLSTVGLEDWIAPDPAALPHTVLARLADVAALARVRNELPARMRASALMDEAGFARDVEALYTRAWDARRP